MESSGLNSETAAIIDLLRRARHAHRKDPAAAPALLIAAVNKAVKAVAPDAEPKEAVHCLTKAGDGWSLIAGYEALEWYHEDSADPGAFSVYGEPDWENYLEIAEGIVMMLAEDNA